MASDFSKVITIRMTANSGTAFKGDKEDEFEWQNAFQTLAEFLESQKEKDLLKEIKETAKIDPSGAWPGCMVVKVALSEEMAIRLFKILEHLSGDEPIHLNSTPPDDLYGIRTEIIKKVDIKKLNLH